MKKINFLIIILIFCAGMLQAQEINTQTPTYKGVVVTNVIDGFGEPVIAGSVYWAGTTTGVFTDENGLFEIPARAGNNLLVAGYVGLVPDTINVEEYEGEFISIELNQPVALNTVEVVSRNKSTAISWVSPIKVEKISTKELQKAACCNLAESFETTPSVDITFSDAITGTRQIQMLGLSGPNTQIMRENMPDVRALSSLNGLLFTPGHWVKGIQLNKGTGSVTNGYESVAGQINVELFQSCEGREVSVNGYTNQAGRMELNLLGRNFLDKEEKYSTGILLHGKYQNIKFDNNNDGFLDSPLGHTLIGANRWKFLLKNGWRTQVGVKGTLFNNRSGQEDFDFREDWLKNEKWGMENEVRRLEGWWKMGRVFADAPWKSFGIQMSGVFHDQDSRYGLKNFNALQQSLYGNFIYKNIIGNTNHEYKTGASIVYDNISENYEDNNFSREEIVPGAFFEYSYLNGEKLTLVTGLRLDYHNIYGAFLTPRAHLRYAPWEKGVFRVSAGRGQRTPNLFIENNAIFVSNRQLELPEGNSDLPYGAKAEVAWNFGINYVQEWSVRNRDLVLSLDYFHTRFENQLVADFEDVRKIRFYNLEGPSFSNSFQVQADYELFPKFDVRLAYRLFDVQISYLDGLKEKPLLARHRSFINLAYETESQWKFDWTLNRQGRKRIPSTISNPESYQMEEYSPAYYLMSAQVTKSFKNNFELYIGGENLLNYIQKDPILAADQPFGEHFDSSLIWGPVFGRNVYLGFRYKIN